MDVKQPITLWPDRTQKRWGHFQYVGSLVVASDDNNNGKKKTDHITDNMTVA